MLYAGGLGFDCRLFELHGLDRNCQRENMLWQEITNMASIYHILGNSHHLLKNSQTVEQLVLEVFNDVLYRKRPPLSWLKIPKLSEKPKILLPWPIST